MLQVDILNTSSLSDPTGPAVLLRKYQENTNFFRNRGYNFSIITPDYFHSVETSTKQRSHTQKSIKSKLKKIITKSKLFTFLYIILLILYSRKLARNYKKLNRSPDIVVFDEFFVYDQYLRLIKNNAKKIQFFHSDGLKFEMLYINFPKLRNTLFAKYLEKRFDKIVKNLDKIVFIAKVGQKNFLRINPYINASKTAFFHNGIEDLNEEQKNVKTEIPEHKKFKYRFICTGTVSERKGQYLIINALSKINKDILEDLHLTLLGTGSQMSELEEFVNINNLKKHISFEGSVSNSSVYIHLKQANIYILMSKNEGLPISIIEAMRAGLPIISTKIAGIPELIDHEKNGILLDPDEKQLIDLFNNINYYNWGKMGKHSRYRFENEFTFDKMREAYCDMLDSMQ